MAITELSSPPRLSTLYPKAVLSGLAPGQSLKINVTFRNPTNAFIGFTPKLFSDPWSL